MRWITRSFRNLLIAALLGLVALFGLPTFIYVTVTHTDQLVQERGNMLSYLADTAATIIGENLRERSREVQLLAQSPLYSASGLDNKKLSTSLARMQKTYPYYSWIGLADMKGVVQVATDNLLEGQSVAQRPWFQQARHGVYVGDLHEAILLAKLLPELQGQVGPSRFIDFAAQVADAQGNPVGVLGVHAHWGWSRDLIKLVTPPDAKQQGVEIYIVDQNNEILFPDAPAGTDQRKTVPDIDPEAPARYVAWKENAQYLTAAATVQSPQSTVPLVWKVVVRQPKEKVLLHATELQQAITLVFGLALLGFVILAILLGRYFGRPVQQLTRIAQAIAQGRPAQFNAQVKTVELHQLNQALQNMSSRLLANQHALEAAARELERKVAERTQELAQANRQLAEQARTDALTHLPNRLAANEFLAHEFRLLTRRPVPYAVLLIDIDYFKKVNDQYGHAVGDTVLQQVGATLAGAVRSNDFLGRIGGEEFMAVLPMTAMREALAVADKLRLAVQASPVVPVGQLTVSIGVAAAQNDDASVEDAVKRADAMLYQAKGAGRNCVMPAGLTLCSGVSNGK